jgi:HAD superfamily hydrolase (TIGR01509 family)
MRLAVDALVFDMDGLLLDTESLALRALQKAGGEIGLEMSDALCRSMIGVAADRSRLLLIECHGESAPADPLFAAAARHLEAQIEAGLLRVKPGVTQLLEFAEKADLPRAVATSSSRRKALHHLHAAGIVDRFDAVVTRDDVSRGKPHPDLFLHAARALAKAPARCLALEDSYNGVRAAHAAGMPVVMVPDLLPPTDEMRELCRAVVDDLHEVVPMLLDRG